MANYLTIHSNGSHFDIASFTGPKYDKIFIKQGILTLSDLDAVATQIAQQLALKELKRTQADHLYVLLQNAKSYLAKGAQIIYSTRPDNELPD